jgi:Protein of unknown function (DUF1648).
MKAKFNLYNFILESLALLFLVANILMLLSSYGSLPDTIITHYNINGIPDGYGNKESIIPPLLISVFIYIQLSVLQNFPQLYNYPVKVTEKNKDALLFYALRLLKYIKLSVSIMFFSISFCSIQNKAMGGFGVFLIMAPIIPSLYYIIKMRQLKD